MLSKQEKKQDQGSVPGRLVKMYETKGIDLVAGLNPAHLKKYDIAFKNYDRACATWFIKDGEDLTDGLGIALQEIYFLECLFTRFQPKRLFAIGNALGWSSLALAILNPNGEILVIDSGSDRGSLDGIALTNSLAAEHGLNLTVLQATSPTDVERVLVDGKMMPIDFVFIDGTHNVDQVVVDFNAIYPHAHENCIYLFHDVASFDLQEGISNIAARTGLTSKLFLGTTSGIAIVYKSDHSVAPILDDIAAFAPAQTAVDVIRSAARRHHRGYVRRFRRALKGYLRSRFKRAQPHGLRDAGKK